MQTSRFNNVLATVISTFILFTFYFTGLTKVLFHPDESWWIAASVVFEPFFSAQWNSPVWEESYWTIIQPPVARYCIGVSRRVAGYKWADLPLPWDWNLDGEANAQRGAVPSDDLLWWSRLPMAALAVFSIMIGFVLVRESAGYLAGCVWILISVASSYFLVHLRRAMGEAPLLAFAMFVALACYQVLRLLRTGEADRTWKMLGWFCLAGIGIGLAGGSKLNGLSAGLAGVVLAFLLAVDLGRSVISKTSLGILSALGIVLFLTLTFVGLYPYLWPAPVERTQKMFDHKLGEMERQAQIYPQDHINSLKERIQVVPERIFQTYAVMSFKGSFVINGLLFLTGLWHILSKLWKEFSTRRSFAPGPTAILLVGIAVSAPPLLTPLDWDRFYLFPVFFSTIFIAIGIAWWIDKVYQTLKRAVPARGGSGA